MRGGGQETIQSPSSTPSRRKKAPKAKPQHPSKPQDEGTDQLSRNKEVQDVTNQILTLIDERAYLLGIPKPSSAAKDGIIATLDGINLLTVQLTRKEAELEEMRTKMRTSMKTWAALLKRIKEQDQELAASYEEESKGQKKYVRLLEDKTRYLEGKVGLLENKESGMEGKAS